MSDQSNSAESRAWGTYMANCGNDNRHNYGNEGNTTISGSNNTIGAPTTYQGPDYRGSTTNNNNGSGVFNTIRGDQNNNGQRAAARAANPATPPANLGHYQQWQQPYQYPLQGWPQGASFMGQTGPMPHQLPPTYNPFAVPPNVPGYYSSPQGYAVPPNVPNAAPTPPPEYRSSFAKIVESLRARVD